MTNRHESETDRVLVRPYARECEPRRVQNRIHKKETTKITHKCSLIQTEEHERCERPCLDVRKLSLLANMTFRGDSRPAPSKILCAGSGTTVSTKPSADVLAPSSKVTLHMESSQSSSSPWYEIDAIVIGRVTVSSRRCKGLKVKVIAFRPLGKMCPTEGDTWRPTKGAGIVSGNWKRIVCVDMFSKKTVAHFSVPTGTSPR